MRLGNLNGRLVIIEGDGVHDVEEASHGRFHSSPQVIFDRWSEFSAWGRSASLGSPAPYDQTLLGAPVPHPRQIFGVGLNYRGHAEEAGLPLPESPLIFAKFPSSITGPYDPIEITVPTVDFEVELVIVIGKAARRVSLAQSLDHIAGFTVGQDLSDRARQWEGQTPQFSVGKSRPGFSPIGPAVVTLDEFENASRLEISCALDGEVLQHAWTDDLIFGIPQLIESISAVVDLLPGDLVFTGTPAGVGAAREPARFLQPGEALESRIEGIGSLRNQLVAPAQSVRAA